MSRKIPEKAVDALIEKVIAASLTDDLSAWLANLPEPSLECDSVQWNLDALPDGPLPTPVKVRTVADDETGPITGTKPITIRVPNRVLRKFWQEAERTGTPYQTLMNRALQDGVDAFA